ncbi:pyridoxal phosphate-dependent aminotransferase [soil metagenome]|jgi:cystathionine beta-lyase|nr:pyridoxal phosphate-dependent aminotransferase [Deinococcota bacterium]
MVHAFDTLRLEDLQARHCAKWQKYGPEVIPLWVADMDFPTALPIVKAVQARAASGNLGYPSHTGEPGLVATIRGRMEKRMSWRFEEGDVWLTGGIIQGLYLAALACASEGEEVIVQSPIYPPFLAAIADTGRVPRYNGLRWNGAAYDIDLEGLEALVSPATRLLMLCNPHNPTGRVFSRDELEGLADFALRHRLWVVSDELHCDLVYEGRRHIPFASLSAEVAQRTVTLLGPTKTFNIAGLKVGVVVSQNPGLLARFKRLGQGLVTPPNVLAQSAALAAYREGGEWLEDSLAYLTGNRAFLGEFLRERLPQIGYAEPEGTYLAWLDLRGLGLAEDLYPFLLLEAKVGLNEGPQYGPGGEGFARLNFATSRAILQEALVRLEGAWRARRG